MSETYDLPLDEILEAEAQRSAAEADEYEKWRRRIEIISRAISACEYAREIIGCILDGSGMERVEKRLDAAADELRALAQELQAQADEG